MAYFFENINILIDGSPILCSDASVSFSNSLQAIYPVGFVGSYNQLPTSSIKSSFQFSYLMRVDTDPAYNVVNNLKNYLPQSSSTIVIGGLSGEAFLQSYSIKATPNQPNIASISYVGFTPLSGALQAKQIELNNSGDFTGISHSWVTYLGNSGDIQTQPIYSLDYNFTATWQPTFILGNINPFQVDFMSAAEEIKFVSENFNNLSFSGTNLTDSYVDPSQVQYLLLFGLALLTNNDKNRYFSFDITNHKITKTNFVTALDSMVTTEITTAKYY